MERIDPVVFINADHLHLDLLSLGQVFIDVADVGIGDFGNVHQPGFSPGQRYKCAEFGDSRDLSFQNSAYLDLVSQTECPPALSKC